MTSNPILPKLQPSLISIAFALILGLVANACVAAASENQFPGPVYVTLQSSGVVENVATGQSWQGLSGAHYLSVGPNATRLLVSSVGTPNVYLVDAATGEKLKTFDIGPAAQGVQIGPKGKFGLAVSAGGGTAAVINIKTGKLVKTIRVGKTPHNAAFSANGRRAYVTLQGGDGVAVLDMDALAKIGEFAVPGLKLPHNLDLSANGKILWVRGFLGKAAAIDLTTHKVLAVIPVGPSHGGIDVIPGGRYIFTGGIGGDVVDVIDPHTLKVIKRINVGLGPHGVRASRDGRWVYAGVTGTNKVAVIDTRTLSVVKQVPTDGTVPFWIAVPGND